MMTLLSLVTCFAAALATLSLHDRAGFAPQSLGVLGLWSVSPYLGHAALALGARRDRDRSVAILIGTLAGAVLAHVALANDLRPWIDARARGDVPPMNCGGPLVEFGVPLLQWISLVVLGWVVSTARPDGPSPDDPHPSEDRPA